MEKTRFWAPLSLSAEEKHRLHDPVVGEAGLLERRKEGSWVFVALGPDAVVRPLFAALDGWGAESAEHAADLAVVDAPSLDAWTTAAALAAVTERLELMVAVRPTFHQPASRVSGGQEFSP